jgi:O-antigen/teichoic acid export membrane protein
MDIPLSMMVAIPSLTGMFVIERPLITFGYGIKKTGLFDP